jgi:hypothetical protein
LTENCNNLINNIKKLKSTIPSRIIIIFKKIIESSVNKYKNKTVESIIIEMFFKQFLIPSIKNPELSKPIFNKVGINEFVLLKDTQERLEIITKVISNFSKGSKYDKSSNYFTMNQFIEEREEFIQDFFEFLDSYEEEEFNMKLNIQKYSPVTIKFEEILFMYQLIEKSESFQNEGFEMGYNENTKEETKFPQVFKNLEKIKYIKDNNLKNFLLIYNQNFLKEIDYLSVLNHDIDIKNNENEKNHDLDVKNENFEIEKKSLKKLLKRILTNHPNILKNLILCKNEKNSIEKILDKIIDVEKVSSKILTISMFTELKNQIFRIFKNNKEIFLFFNEIKSDIEIRNKNIMWIHEKNKDFLKKIKIYENYIFEITNEYTMLLYYFENERIKSFLESISFSSFKNDFWNIKKDTKSFRNKPTSIHDIQDKKFVSFFESKQNDFKNFLKKSNSNLSHVEINKLILKLKRFILIKLYKEIIDAYSLKDLEIWKKLSNYSSMISPFDVDIKKGYWDFLKSPFIIINESLSNLHTLVSPEMKLQKIVQISEVIIEMMKLSGDGFPAIDDFLPILIYFIIKINPKNIYSTIYYTYRFNFLIYESSSNLNYEKDLNSEYWLKHFECALLFIENELDDFIKTQNEKNQNLEIRKTFTMSFNNFEKLDSFDLSISPPNSDIIRKRTNSFLINNIDVQMNQNINEDDSFEIFKTSKNEINQNFKKFIDYSFDELSMKDVKELLFNYKQIISHIEN